MTVLHKLILFAFPLPINYYQLFIINAQESRHNSRILLKKEKEVLLDFFFFLLLFTSLDFTKCVIIPHVSQCGTGLCMKFTIS